MIHLKTIDTYLINYHLNVNNTHLAVAMSFRDSSVSKADSATVGCGLSRLTALAPLVDVLMEPWTGSSVVAHRLTAADDPLDADDDDWRRP